MEETIIQNDLIDKINEIEPVLRKHSLESEENRRLSEPVVEALKQAGLFRLWKPKEYGGLEVDPITAFEIFEALARIDSAAGWNVQLTAGLDVILQCFPDEPMNEVFSSEEEVIFAASWYPPGSAIPVEGGYKVTGQWNISSGCQYANWFFNNAIVMDGDKPRTYEDGQPVIIFTIVPAREGSIKETWNTIGMKGTGSHSIVLENVFVPKHRTTAMVPVENAVGSAFQGPLYQNSVWYAVAALAGPAPGIARAALDEIFELVQKKVPNYLQTTLKDNQIVQMKLAEAEATLRAGRAYLFEVLNSTWETAQQGLRITMDQRIQLQLASTYALESSVNTVKMVYDIAGLTGMRESSRIQKHFRDIHVMHHHAFISPNRYQAVGQLMLGLEPNWGFFYF